MKKSELRQIIKEEIKEFLVRRNLYNLKEETEFEAYYNGKKIQIKAKDLWDAKKQAIAQFKVPKSKEGRVAVQSLKSKANQDFRFEDYNWNNEPNNKIYWKPKNLKKIGWIIINRGKNDGRPLYALYDTDDSKWGADYRMGSGRHPENSPLFYTVPIKVEGNKFRILSENEKWSRPYAYFKIDLKGKDY